MSPKNITIGAIIIVIIIGAIYFIFKGVGSSSSQQAQQPAAAAQTATTTPQVQAQDVTVGTGEQATPGSVVSVLYVGKLSDGTVFDSSAAHGNQPLTFQLGAQGLIPGFQIGVNGMKVGGERLMAIPPELGYGSQPQTDSSGKVVIPANSTLIFDVKLVKVGAASSTPTTTAPAAAH